jgi:hypothetical protein
MGAEAAEGILPMNTVAILELLIRLGDDHTPASACIALQHEVRDETGRVRLSPDFSDLAALEGHINALQDELDSIRMEARRVFQVVD